ncbi:FMN-binding negative transcriptional regulator [Nitratireductor aquibiodomus]|uniref:FMN-binding negative transcriptional regulator n=1 Tax=Nitratireductor aquibiodomus TaxID=204799 RepID=UPI000469D9C3|nr:FMN-binding negative transcriptional regulator [Nitratireductor aquibiodomus]
MYTPASYREQDTAFLHDLMREWSFATIVSHGQDGLLATHLPFLLAPGGHKDLGILTSHIARNNAQWRHFEAGGEALIIFQGPNAFVSVNWYDMQRTFPTWNYGAIHVYGKVRLNQDPEINRKILEKTIARYERPQDGDWSFETMPEEMIAPRLRAIVGLEIEIDRIEGKLKFNQDKSEADRKGVRAALARDVATAPSADFMERLGARSQGEDDDA